MEESTKCIREIHVCIFSFSFQGEDDGVVSSSLHRSPVCVCVFLVLFTFVHPPVLMCHCLPLSHACIFKRVPVCSDLIPACGYEQYRPFVCHLWGTFSCCEQNKKTSYLSLILLQHIRDSTFKGLLYSRLINRRVKFPKIWLTFFFKHDWAKRFWWEKDVHTFHPLIN